MLRRKLVVKVSVRGCGRRWHIQPVQGASDVVALLQWFLLLLPIKLLTNLNIQLDKFGQRGSLSLGNFFHHKHRLRMTQVEIDMRIIFQYRALPTILISG